MSSVEDAPKTSNAKSIWSFGLHTGAIVVLVAIVGLLTLAVRLHAFEAVTAYVDGLIWRRLPPSWPRPPQFRPPHKDDPAKDEGKGAKDDTKGKDAKDAKDDPKGRDCPDGSGLCESDDGAPLVLPPLAFSPNCQDLTIEDMLAHESWDSWTASIPIVGPIAKSIGTAWPNRWITGPSARAASALDDAGAELKEANALWQNAYAVFLAEAAPEVLRSVKGTLGPGGYVDTLAAFTARPLVHAAWLLVSPVLSLLVASCVLLWAV